MRQEEQRRIPRVSVCCRVDVRDPSGVWTGVTDDVSVRGCRIVTGKLPRVGSVLELTISSDLFPEALEVAADVAWVSEECIGVTFLEPAGRSRARKMSPAKWVESVIEHGRVQGPEALDAAAPRVVPAIVRRSARLALDARRGNAGGSGGAEDGGGAVVLPMRKR